MPNATIVDESSRAARLVLPGTNVALTNKHKTEVNVIYAAELSAPSHSALPRIHSESGATPNKE
jgi:hypothetical protein